MIRMANKRRLAAMETELSSLRQVAQQANKRVWDLNARVMKLREQIENDLWATLLEHLGTEELVLLCNEYANVSYCAEHKTYFPRSLKICMACSAVQIQKDWKFNPKSRSEERRVGKECICR